MNFLLLSALFLLMCIFYNHSYKVKIFIIKISKYFLFMLLVWNSVFIPIYHVKLSKTTSPQKLFQSDQLWCNQIGTVRKLTLFMSLQLMNHTFSFEQIITFEKQVSFHNWSKIISSEVIASWKVSIFQLFPSDWSHCTVITTSWFC